MKVWKWLAPVLVLLLIVFFVGKSLLLEKMVAGAIARTTGFGVKFESFDVKLIASEFEIVDLQLMNPPGYDPPRAMEVRQLLVKYNLWSLLGKTPHFYELTLDIPELALIQNEDGDTNFGELVANLQKQGAGGQERGQPAPAPTTPAPEAPQPDQPPPPPAGPPAPPPAPPFRIDCLNVKLGQVMYVRHKAGETQPDIQTLDINVNETYRDVTSPERLAADILSRIVSRQAAQRISDWADDHQEDMEQLGLDKKDVQKAAEQVQGFLKAFR